MLPRSQASVVFLLAAAVLLGLGESSRAQETPPGAPGRVQLAPLPSLPAEESRPGRAELVPAGETPRATDEPSDSAAAEEPESEPEAEHEEAAETSAAHFTHAVHHEISPPNMMGDSLRGYRGITFQYLLPGGSPSTGQSVFGPAGVVGLRNTSIAENNSAIPRDRFTFRYNYLHNALDVRGLEPAGQYTASTDIARRPGARAPQFDRPGTFRPPGSPSHVRTPTVLFDAGGMPLRDADGNPRTVPQQTTTYTQTEVRPGARSYDAHLFTLGFEKTYLDGNLSVEMRVPFTQTLDFNLNLEAGTVDPETLFVRNTPGATLGNTDTQLQDVQAILKALLYHDERWAVSAGFGILAPTGPDLHARVVDFSGNEGLATNRRDPLTERNLLDGNGAFDRRVREFEVDNETWAISPFLAVAAQPRPRVFFNGFWQFDAPMNESDWRYQSTDVDLAAAAALQRDRDVFVPGLGAVPPFIETAPGVPTPQPGPTVMPYGPIQNREGFSGEIEDQWLMHLNLGGGYWLYHNPDARGITGLASILELHYTTTLDDAEIAEVPAQRLRANGPAVTGINRAPSTGAVQSLELGPPEQPEQRPLIGNVGNRVDVLNATVGATVLLGDRATAAVGYVFPIRDDDFDKLFDGELNVQFNCYFGGSGPRGPETADSH